MYKRGTPEYDKWRKSPEYALFCRRVSAAMTGRQHSAETRAKQSAAHMGKHHSAETLAKLTGERNHNYGKHPNKETRGKNSAAHMGERNPFYGKHHSEKTKQKISVANSGKQRSEEFKQKISIANKGKILSAKTRQKMSVAFRGRIVSKKTREKISEALKGRPRPDLRGSNHPNWRGGSSDPYPIGWNHHLREMIRERDKFTCVLCGKAQTTQRHPVHHINYEKDDLRPKNLITLCTTCHSKTNGDRKYWTALFEGVYIPDFPKIRRKNESSC